MTQIGTFARNSDGSYTGTIKTLAFNVQARLTPSDPATASEKAPDLRVVVSGVEIGAAWRRTSKDDRIYHSVKLDDPSFTAPIYANLFEGEDGEHALICRRTASGSYSKVRCCSVCGRPPLIVPPATSIYLA